MIVAEPILAFLLNGRLHFSLFIRIQTPGPPPKSRKAIDCFIGLAHLPDWEQLIALILFIHKNSLMIISLENFDEQGRSRPILNSPRSIEACRRQGIEPE